MNHKHSLKIKLFSFVLVLIAVSPAFGAATVTNTTNAPTNNLIFEQDPTAGGFSLNYSWTRDWQIGQSFYAATNLTATNITFAISVYTPEGLSKPFTLEIYKTINKTNSPALGTLISSSSGNLPATLISNSYLTFTPTSDVSLEATNWYIFMLVSGTGSTNSSVSFPMYSNNADMDNTYSWYKDTGSYGRYTTRSFEVYVQGIPEPSTTMVLALAGVLLSGVMVLRRKTRRGASGNH